MLDVHVTVCYRLYLPICRLLPKLAIYSFVTATNTHRLSLLCNTNNINIVFLAEIYFILLLLLIFKAVKMLSNIWHFIRAPENISAALA